jgi:hypothetical protein
MRQPHERSEQLRGMQYALCHRRQLQCRCLHVRGRRDPVRHGVLQYPDRDGQLRGVRSPLRGRDALQRRDVHGPMQHRRRRHDVRGRLRQSRDEQRELRIVQHGVSGWGPVH